MLMKSYGGQELNYSLRTSIEDGFIPQILKINQNE